MRPDCRQTNFTSSGFCPRRPEHGERGLEDLAAQPRESAQTLIFYEAPHRIADTLADLEAVFGPALRIAAARELTKLHEEFLRGSVSEVRRQLAERDRIRGEFVLLIEAPSFRKGLGGPGLDSQTQDGNSGARESISAGIKRLQSETGLDEKEALKRLARESGRSKSELYRELQRERARRT